VRVQRKEFCTPLSNLRAEFLRLRGVMTALFIGGAYRLTETYENTSNHKEYEHIQQGISKKKKK